MGPIDRDQDAAGDLDALIGDIRREAARRRAAPDFPLDDEARLSTEMAAQGPAGVGGVDLAAVIAALRSFERTGDGAAAEVAGLAASAAGALSVRVAELERRAARPPAVAPPAPAAAPTEPEGGAEALAAAWGSEVAASATAAAARPGRILVAGAGAQVWVDRLASAGLDAYGVDPSLGEFGDRGPVRSGEMADHLPSVGDASLALAVVAGPLSGHAADRLAELAGELVRTTGRVVVCSEAPWAWRRRVGDGPADTSPWRPVGPEAWLQALAGCGVPATGRYDAQGRSYLLVAEVAPRAVG